ncbi:mechanosensitive ion channel family protein [Roseovarius spongiae]|uniref:Mechanosensitive ion channel family protein n=1 Tax=Roseovarius spongiae TaxID=2320272 RepID=A0A3A8AWG0_9RHOB|nr:DUF3772 domain-containing protein [Roseovarius spongiae]RKF16683.1 mechanosensitive ion channel family protein [Roseovarius spongiae]
MMALLRTLLIALTLAFLPAALAGPGLIGGATAQQAAPMPDYEQWRQTAARANSAIETARASTPALEELRAQLVDWRDRFLAAQTANANAISTVQAQIAALGAPPESGEEAPEIAKQRAELNDQLNRLTAPVRQAQLAYSQADGMIKGIDSIIRDRQADELLELGPSPLNPKHWQPGVNALAYTIDTIRNEVVSAWDGETRYTEFKNDLPKVIVLAILGLVLLIRGRFWVELAARFVLPSRVSSAHWLIALLMSLGEIVVPFIGLLFLIQAAHSSGIVGLRGDLVLSALKPAFFIFLLVRWQALRVFPRVEAGRLPLQLEPEQRRSGRWYGGALGLIIAAFYFFRRIGEVNNWSEAAVNVILFPVMVIAGLLLIRLARLLRRHYKNIAADETADTYRNRLMRLLSQALFLLAVAAPALAAVGYYKAAVALMLPSLLSLILLSLLLILQRMVTELYMLASRDREGAADDLMPVLLSFALVILSSPFFALIWGARAADLSELWMKFTQGITLGGMTISPTIFITLAIIFTIGFIVTRLLQGTLKNTLLPKTRMDAGGRNAIVSGVGYIGIFLSAIIAITSAGIDLSSLAIVAGALSVGIGFGLQNIVSNFVSGIILLIERPISQGDWIEVGGQHGTVKEISVRSTRIQTFDRSDLIIPNADLVSGTVTNYTRGNTVGRCVVSVGVSYAADTKKVQEILTEIASANPMVLMNPPPSVIFSRIGTDAFEFDIRMILRDINWVMNVTDEVNHEIARRFAAEGIEMPYAQRDLWIRNPEALAPAVRAAGQGTPPPQDADAAPEQPERPEDPSDAAEAGPDGESR